MYRMMTLLNGVESRRKKRKMTESKETQSSGTTVQIFKSCVESHIEDLRVLGVNWIKKYVKV